MLQGKTLAYLFKTVCHMIIKYCFRLRRHSYTVKHTKNLSRAFLCVLFACAFWAIPVGHYANMV